MINDLINKPMSGEQIDALAKRQLTSCIYKRKTRMMKPESLIWICRKIDGETGHEIVGYCKIAKIETMRKDDFLEGCSFKFSLKESELKLRIYLAKRRDFELITRVKLQSFHRINNDYFSPWYEIKGAVRMPAAFRPPSDLRRLTRAEADFLKGRLFEFSQGWDSTR